MKDIEDLPDVSIGDEEIVMSGYNLDVCKSVVQDAVKQWYVYVNDTNLRSTDTVRNAAVHILHDAGITAGVLLEFPELLEKMPLELVQRLLSGYYYRELDREQADKVEENARKGVKFVSEKEREGYGAVLVPMGEDQYFLVRMNGRQIVMRDNSTRYEFGEYGPGPGMVDIAHSDLLRVRKTPDAQNMTGAYHFHCAKIVHDNIQRELAVLDAAYNAMLCGRITE